MVVLVWTLEMENLSVNVRTIWVERDVIMEFTVTQIRAKMELNAKKGQIEQSASAEDTVEPFAQMISTSARTQILVPMVEYVST